MLILLMSFLLVIARSNRDRTKFKCEHIFEITRELTAPNPKKNH
jgi:hypothetical protein